MPKQVLLCDFHIHSRFSDGDLPLSDVVDLYGAIGFDVIAITDHLADSESGRSPQKGQHGIQDTAGYFRALRQKSRRAFEQYDMLLIPGLEISNNSRGYHVLGLGISEAVDPDAQVEGIVDDVHAQSGIPVACHPYTHYTYDARPMTYLWEHRNDLRTVFDAWEVANARQFFGHVALEGLNYVGNSDFHRVEDVYSWKNLLYCEKAPAAVLDEIRSARAGCLTLLWERKLCSERLQRLRRKAA